MKIGIISDIHAQLSPLERALNLLIKLGVDRIICAGDLVEKGPDGDAVVETLRACCIPCVMGNHDHNAVEHARLELEIAPEERLKAETLSWLESLPLTWSWCWEGLNVMMAHATPTSFDARVTEDLVPKRFRRWARSHPADVLILGHTHNPMAIKYGRLSIFNPGSLSNARLRDSFTCAVLELPSLEFTVYDLETGDAV